MPAGGWRGGFRCLCQLKSLTNLKSCDTVISSFLCIKKPISLFMSSVWPPLACAELPFEPAWAPFIRCLPCLSCTRSHLHPFLEYPRFDTHAKRILPFTAHTPD